jgi:hypothetical protein
MTNSADDVWDRAAMEAGGQDPRAGDSALSGLLSFHSRAMSGGVLDAVETATTEDLAAAEDGFRFFALADAADVVARVRSALAAGDLSESDLEELEGDADSRYAAIVPSDETIVERFESRLRSEPDLFAPV